MEYVPNRGDVLFITLDPHSSALPGNRRPVLVVSPEAYNRRVGLALLCPIVEQSKGYPFEVPMPSGLIIAGTILADQVRSLDWRTREAHFLCQLPVAITTEVLQKLHTLVTVTA